jgi:hypothetical protein
VNLNINRRLEQLEEKNAERRCAQCIAWPANRFVSDDVLGHSDGSFTSLTSDTPSECAVCGYRPRVIRIKHVDDWHARRAEHTTE